MVLNQLTPSLQPSDLFMADEAEGSGEGSGDGSVSSHAGWDDDDNVDEYSSGDGSGENPITTQLPGVADPKGNFEINTANTRARETALNSWYSFAFVFFFLFVLVGHPTDISAPKPGSDIVIHSKEPTGAAPSLHVPLLIMVCLIPVTRIF